MSGTLTCKLKWMAWRRSFVAGMQRCPAEGGISSTKGEVSPARRAIGQVEGRVGPQG